MFRSFPKPFQWRQVAFLLVIISQSAAHAGIPLPKINTNYVVTVTSLGAVGDSVTTNTTAIQNAITAASNGGLTNGLKGGVVEIPAAAGTYLSGPLTMANNVDIQIDSGATLQMLPYGSYPGGTSPTDFIGATKLHDIEISGSGTIDGQGSIWWATNKITPGGINRPKAMFAPSTCTNILITGVTLQNPPNTHISFRSVCVNVTVDGIVINTPNGTPNTDGIDCSAANVLIADSHISDGDDHIAMGDGHAGSFNHDITISNCLFGTGHGVSIGSYTTGGLSNLLVINCIWTNGSSGIHLKADDDRGGLVQDLKYLNLAMTNCQIPIFLYSYYTNSGTSTGASVAKAAAYPAFPVSSTTPIWRDILISNVVALPTNGFPAGIIWGKPEMSFSNVVMDKVNITASSYFQLYNAQGVQLIDSQITVSKTNTFGCYNAQLIITNSSPAANLVKLEGVSTNGYVNALNVYNAQATLAQTNMLAGNRGVTLGAGTLTISNNLALSASDVYSYVLGGGASSVVVKGSLALGGTNNIIAGSGFTNGTYTLMTYTGTLSGTTPVLGSVPPDFNYAFDTTTAGQVNLVITLPTPPAPANLMAQGTNLSVGLQWFASPGASGYNLMRSTTNGGPYGVITSPGTTNYSDSSVNPGTTYYYVVSATNSFGASPNSVQASAVPLPSLNSTNLVFAAGGNQLQLSWPPDHLGWRLEIQTNSLANGLGTNWVTVPNSTNIITTNMIITPANDCVFYRLAYP
jgi:hypothetical protein